LSIPFSLKLELPKKCEVNFEEGIKKSVKVFVLMWIKFSNFYQLYYPPFILVGAMLPPLLYFFNDKREKKTVFLSTLDR